MPWDDELEQLQHFIVEHLGEAVIDEAVRQAVKTVRQTAAVIGIDTGQEDLTPVIEGHLFSPNEFYEALRTELRRVARPH